ncbi:hypothetical protein LCGC14_0504180 [marine sediment metagenome]|uniref:Uncharacterized protein n=1 Tax=marine sediment metagenome TaxID=412755 RepID=A0A0F9VBN3_9ZZZZ
MREALYALISMWLWGGILWCFGVNERGHNE